MGEGSGQGAGRGGSTRDEQGGEGAEGAKEGGGGSKGILAFGAGAGGREERDELGDDEEREVREELLGRLLGGVSREEREEHFATTGVSPGGEPVDLRG